ncbi:MAG: phosphoribosylglycinamide synthetase [Aeriscardovia sp.]|nr:phosphoribosylglycinamide synthetase [Aeriscardovia sp.]MBO5633215.1 phosphoribosylglycinamide synthetase [Aeriscardovia sp.]
MEYQSQAIDPPPEKIERRHEILSISAERLSQVRYAFIVQTEDGIPSAYQQAALEYADAVLFGWSDNDDDLQEPTEHDTKLIQQCVQSTELHLTTFCAAEKNNKTNIMADNLIQIADNIAQIRKIYQPDFLVPTFAEIKRVVTEEWNQNMILIGSDIDEKDLHSGFQSEINPLGTQDE